MSSGRSSNDAVGRSTDQLEPPCNALDASCNSWRAGQEPWLWNEIDAAAIVPCNQGLNQGLSDELKEASAVELFDQLEGAPHCPPPTLGAASEKVEMFGQAQQHTRALAALSPPHDELR
eukprot:CAMPEP_0119338430 /NCGR_PEP_ID=MMETSP1333-20130426/96019_1 /TAXON_ID=418940 /ORGANISM="Scyphosphaera apsteinii, Strain RCC1455" /LENGTH=118 /DNA_ID=CAMNT_0007349707 /DNA_START=82 /DNA_END=434 /DNA_ORIENTATION=+